MSYQRRPLPRAVSPLLMLFAFSIPAFAASSPSEAIRMFFEGLDAGAAPSVGAEHIHNPALLAALYGERGHEPLWTSGGPLEVAREELVRAIETSAAHGLNRAHYHYERLRDASPGPDTHVLLTTELLATDAFLQQVRHRSSGAVSPNDLDSGWHFIRPEVEPLATFRHLLDSGDPLHEVLDALWPASSEYLQLVEERARILALGELDVERVPPGPLLKPGQSGERVVALKKRLFGPDEHSPFFDDTLREAVLAFQLASGLETDGIVGDATLEVLNATRFSWIDRIDANLERWRWLPRREPETYLRVNIAAYSLRVIRAGEDALDMDVIVGRPFRRTPVFTETVKYLVFNPYWNVPHRIAVQDKLPALKRDAAELEAQGYQVRPTGGESFVAVTSVDWSTVERDSFHYLLRQRPGPQNALGRVKFMLPNLYSVYLHDTPTRELFSHQERSFSSGCIRLSQALELASWVLANDGQMDAARRVPELASGDRTVTLHLRTPLPAYVVYFTAFTDASGEVVFRRDLYQRDAALVAALRTESPS